MYRLFSPTFLCVYAYFSFIIISIPLSDALVLFHHKRAEDQRIPFQETTNPIGHRIQEMKPRFEFLRPLKKNVCADKKTLSTSSCNWTTPAMFTPQDDDLIMKMETNDLGKKKKVQSDTLSSLTDLLSLSASSSSTQKSVLNSDVTVHQLGSIPIQKIKKGALEEIQEWYSTPGSNQGPTIRLSKQIEQEKKQEKQFSIHSPFQGRIRKVQRKHRQQLLDLAYVQMKDTTGSGSVGSLSTFPNTTLFHFCSKAIHDKQLLEGTELQKIAVGRTSEAYFTRYKNWDEPKLTPKQKSKLSIEKFAKSWLSYSGRLIFGYFEKPGWFPEVTSVYLTGDHYRNKLDVTRWIFDKNCHELVDYILQSHMST